MFEQLKIQKEPVVLAPQSPQNHNKLQTYFESSSFLHQQQQLSIFIKDLPIINLRQIKSVNSLISLLIKQNELIGNKCQQQVGLLKQEYLKHDKLIKTNKEIKIERDKYEKQKKQLEERLNAVKFSSQKENLKNEQLQLKERKLEAQSIKLGALLKEAQDKIGLLHQVLQQICMEEYKKVQQKCKTQSSSEFNFSPVVIQYCQNQRKKQKNYSKISNIVSQFCARLQKVVKVVSPTVLQQQLSIETSNMMDLISDIFNEQKSKKKRKKTEGNEKHLSSTSERGNSSHRNANFFEGMIRKLAQCASNNSTTKQQISNELQQVKISLQQSKNHYENVLNNLRQQFQVKQQQIQKKLRLKQQTIKYYQQQIQKLRELSIGAKQKNGQFQTEVANLKRQIEQKDFMISSLENKLGFIQKQTKQQVQNLKTETQLRIEQLKKMAALKISQREQMINESNDRRKKQQSEHQAEVSELKFKAKLMQQQKQEIQRNLKTHIKTINQLEDEYSKMESYAKELKLSGQKQRQKSADLEDKYSKKIKQIDEFKEALNSLQHEKSLQSAYIAQLQTKIETLNNKIKNLQTKTKSEAANKKEITAMKNTIVEEKQRTEQYEAYCAQIKDQNLRLKSIVKQMKKQLEDVYIRLSELKQIQAERERLFLQAQNSDRIRENILKENEEIKLQMLKLQAENKKMHLQLKHFKNIVSRIKLLEEN